MWNVPFPNCYAQTSTLAPGVQHPVTPAPGSASTVPRPTMAVVSCRKCKAKKHRSKYNCKQKGGTGIQRCKQNGQRIHHVLQAEIPSKLWPSEEKNRYRQQRTEKKSALWIYQLIRIGTLSLRKSESGRLGQKKTGMQTISTETEKPVLLSKQDH